MSGGLGARGIIPGRPNDRMGIGAYVMFVSDDFKDASFILDELADDEFGLEAYCNFAVNPLAANLRRCAVGGPGHHNQ